jgi:hypothetical protein
MSATVKDSDPTTSMWTVVTEPNIGATVIADPTRLDTTVTLTRIGAYVLQIKATDGEYTGSDTVTINVYADRCEAAKSLPNYVPLAGDVNNDCMVDFRDLALMASNWLKNNAL